jgi:hypothetical protein
MSGGDPGATVTGELAPGVGVLASLPEDTPSVSIWKDNYRIMNCEKNYDDHVQKIMLLNLEW